MVSTIQYTIFVAALEVSMKPNCFQMFLRALYVQKEHKELLCDVWSGCTLVLCSVSPGTERCVAAQYYTSKSSFNRKDLK